MAIPELPLAFSTAWRSTRWVYHCRSRSMVVCRSWPSTAGTVVLSPSGMRLPAPTSYFSLPSLPESALLKISSRPP